MTKPKSRSGSQQPQSYYNVRDSSGRFRSNTPASQDSANETPRTPPVRGPGGRFVSHRSQTIDSGSERARSASVMHPSGPHEQAPMDNTLRAEPNPGTRTFAQPISAIPGYLRPVPSGFTTGQSPSVTEAPSSSSPSVAARLPRDSYGRFLPSNPHGGRARAGNRANEAHQDPSSSNMQPPTVIQQPRTSTRRFSSNRNVVPTIEMFNNARATRRRSSLLVAGNLTADPRVAALNSSSPGLPEMVPLPLPAGAPRPWVYEEFRDRNDGNQTKSITEVPSALLPNAIRGGLFFLLNAVDQSWERDELIPFLHLAFGTRFDNRHSFDDLIRQAEESVQNDPHGFYLPPAGPEILWQMALNPHKVLSHTYKRLLVQHEPFRLVLALVRHHLLHGTYRLFTLPHVLSAEGVETIRRNLGRRPAVPEQEVGDSVYPDPTEELEGAPYFLS